MTRPNLNAVALIGEDLDGSVASTGFAVLRPSASILPEFLFQLVQTPRFVSGMTKLTAGQMYPAVSERDVRGFNVSLPPLDEQRRIVDLLGRAAGLKRLAEEAQTKARELIPALFLDMFGDPATNPKGWPLVPLGDTFDAADYGTSVKANDSAGVPVLRMGNVSSSGDLLLADMKYVELRADQLERQRLRPGDILFNRTNSKELVGKTGLWDGRFEAVAASYFIRVRVRSEAADPLFIWAYMNSGHMKRRLFETARGAIGQANINGRELRAFSLPLPPLALQRRFAERVQETEGVQRLATQAAAAAEHATAALMARLFAG